MSVSRWRYTKACDDHMDECPGDCDLCSFEPEKSDRQKGEWKHYQGDLWICSACGEGLLCDDINSNNFCPNCGADMRGDTE